MALRLVTDATAEPVTIEDIKMHLRIQSTEMTEDDYLEGIVKAARKAAENKTKRACLPQTWKLTIDDWQDVIRLPVSPLSSNSTDVVITFLDTSGNSTTLSSTVYTVDSESEPGRIYISYNQVWPDHYDVRNAISVQFVSGYPLTTMAPATDTCPESIEAWIKMRAANMYENREAMSERKMQELPYGHLDGLLDEYLVIEVNP